MGFVHLHLYSEFTIRGSTIRLEELPGRLQELGMGSVALTDRDGVAGLAAFARYARASGIRPIAGMEVRIAPESYPELVDARYRPPCVSLLARTRQGYRNLVALSGHCQRSRRGLPLEVIREHHAGLVLLTGGMAGPISQMILHQMTDQVYGVASELAAIMGEDAIYLEVRRVGHPAEEWVNAILAEAGTSLGIPPVATHECRALDHNDAELLVALRGLDADRPRFARELSPTAIRELYVLDAEMMAHRFHDLPDALVTAETLAETWDDVLPDRCRSHPVFLRKDAPPLDRRAREALQADPAFRHPDYIQRLSEELTLVQRLEAEGEILNAVDIVRRIRQRGGVVGPLLDPFGQTLLAHVLELSELDPLEDGLRAERYFNPLHPRTPDPPILTVDPRGREILRALLGQEGRRVLAPALVNRSLDREVAVELLISWGHEESEVRRLSQEVPWSPHRRRELLVRFPPPGPDEQGLCPVPGELVRRLSGRIDGVRGHPAALIGLDPEDLPDLPSCEDAATGTHLAWSVEDLHALGLASVHALELDVLGLIRTVALTAGIRRIPRKDPATYEMLGRGEVVGVYGFLGDPAGELVREPWPHTLTGLASLLAILQPGREILLERYRRGLRGAREIPSRIRPILSATGGLVLFPVQVIELIAEVAGLPPRRADAILRRAEEEPEQVSDLLEELIRNAVRRGSEEVETREMFRSLFEILPRLSNKSRALAAALLAYKTAYLKRHHPVEFLAGLFAMLLRGGRLSEGFRKATAERYAEEALRLGIVLQGDPWTATSVRPEEGRIRFRDEPDRQGP